MLPRALGSFVGTIFHWDSEQLFH